MKPIVLYDENHERVGETYPRRAKQLLRSGRAFWLDEGNTMCLVTATNETYPPTEEDVSTMTEPVMHNNGMLEESIPPAPVTTGSDDLLLYVAKQNVARKRSLIRHIVAFILALVLFFVSTSFHFSNNHTAQVNEAVVFQQMMEDLPVISYDGVRGSVNIGPNGIWISRYNDAWNIMDAIMEIASVAQLEQQFVARRTMHREMFFLGIFFAWGVWIVVQSVKVVRGNMQNRASRPTKPDPIALEYQRLRGQM